MKRIILLILVIVAVAAAQEGARYLIIVRDQFANSIQPLAEWKHASGMMCKVAKLSETGSSLSEIRSYIQNAYHNWPVRPEFVLLVGHPYYLPSARHGQRWPYYSDNDYADMTGDFRAELAVGRFPAKSISQCEVMVAKTLAYEKEPDLTDSLWMRRLTTIVREDYDPDDTIYWNDVRRAAILAGQAGFVHCDSFSRARGHNTSNVITSVNSGTGFILFRGCATNNWYYPFNVNPAQTNNGRRLPVILSITCETMALDPYDSMVGSAWVKTGTTSNPRGAVAFFGNTHSGTNIAHLRSAATRGFLTGLFTEEKFQLGNVILRAKQQLYQEFPRYSSDYRGFSLFGDPELKVWTATPRMLTVLHPAEILPEPRELEITVLHDGHPIPNALVCASMKPDVYTYDYTDTSGVVSLSVNPSDTGLMRLVVTGRNCHPYDALIHVTTQIGIEEQNPQPFYGGTLCLEAFPAPFSQATRLRWSIPARPDWKLAICDAAGQTVRTFRNLGNNRSVVWNGRNRNGQKVCAGVYFCTILNGQEKTLARAKVLKLD